mmetsp:Transcript_31363/g.35110  ORF Transcript_31363/g.35110 Transcript_31363/m.35110 type:complete len:324 (-) Transcript_31363:103-1074(-)|eukprot:CAMPEP_0171000392 /NCGR_PEP_ID=MMETSP0736-20130129/14746_1 /TAXON_ID=186038 /ORGANISM="Fragilariopsis kerguelensis, Strain L26-C5" /LENGTH=323 /DNA_ID=CAMNT_0011427901 /DNA_START=472 /DNA_END=1443 /DNA_ORIENTATION=+
MNSSTEQIVESIKAMRKQEEHHRFYHVTDYLSKLPKSVTRTSFLGDPPVDELCRSVMGKWCNDIADFCGYKRETVAIAMHCLDRFMATSSGQEILLDRNLYQLAAMTAMYSSVKVHEQEVMDTHLVSRLSQGVHTTATIEAMELKMLNAIHWKINPPTPMSFTRLIINNDLISDYYFLSPIEKETIINITRIQIELTVIEYEFSSFNGSSIAFACMLNAFESCLLDADGVFLANFETTMRNTLLIVDDEECIRNLRVAICDRMNDSNDDNSVHQKEMVNKEPLAKTNKDISSADVITIGGNIISFHSSHSSPRTVVKSCVARS